MNLLKPHHFTTRELPEHAQFEAWRAFMSSSIELSPAAGEASAFPADLFAWDLCGLLFARMVLPSPDVPRFWRHRDRPVMDHWCLELTVEGGVPAATAPHECPARRRIAFRCLGRPCQGTAVGSYVLSLFIPRDQFADVAPALDAVPEQIPDRGLGALLAEFMMSLDRNLPATDEHDLPKLVEATRAVVSACLVANRGLPALERVGAASGTLLERARKIIRHNLRSQELGPDELCRLMGVSRSRLYRLFEPLGGVSNYIRRQRLLQAHAALSDFRNTRHIRLIAENCGFEDASSFSRAYYAEFGYSPSDTRRAALGGHSLPARLAREGEPLDASFNDLMLGLHS
ncbi:helix-turn-helix domain-containing protein [Chelatococcus reniformis]|uniref:AraC family transcriptional regulator n=1 Tax=Chelatococcus reniformis TaxID=1494448 RepID=A0A916UKM4_9HYPH|nr:AraC family transcriptional regulator [Chelatococcus reniformis]GGC76938.1 AraC family transcriptional regulator [Chelatococcus reniformis]